MLPCLLAKYPLLPTVIPCYGIINIAADIFKRVDQFSKAKDCKFKKKLQIDSAGVKNLQADLNSQLIIKI
jgi:hypothetical protein